MGEIPKKIQEESMVEISEQIFEIIQEKFPAESTNKSSEEYSKECQENPGRIQCKNPK